jgi:E3 ubiquitin-protein ligase DOA10
VERIVVQTGGKQNIDLRERRLYGSYFYGWLTEIFRKPHTRERERERERAAAAAAFVCFED